MTTAAHNDESPAAGSTWLGWAAVFCVGVAVYAATANRGPQWQDSGFHILRVVERQVVNPLGLALSHPLHHWLGRVAAALGPGNPAFAITLVSAVAAAVALANVFGCVVCLTRSRPAAAFAAASLGLAHTFWQMATVAESYTLAAALLAGECWCLASFLRRPAPLPILGMFLLNGLGIANHLLAGLTTPVLAVVAVLAWRRGDLSLRSVATAAACWLLGTLSYSGLVLRELAARGDASAVVRSALFGEAYAANVLNTSLSARALMLAVAFILLNFPNATLPAAVLGVWRRTRGSLSPRALPALLAAAGVHAAFVLRYDVRDQHTFFLPLYTLLCIFAGVGAAVFVGGPRSAQAPARAVRAAVVALLLATPVVYALLPHVARHFDLLRGVARHKPYRDDYTYLLTPWSVADPSAERMSSAALRLAGAAGLIVIEDPMAAFAIRYALHVRQVRGVGWVVAETDAQRHDVVLAERIRAARRAGAAVVLVPSNVNEPRVPPPGGQWQRHGDLWVMQ